MTWTTETYYAVGVQRQCPLDGEYYQCISAHTSGTEWDSTKWGHLTPWVRSVDYEQETTATGEDADVIGAVKDVWDNDPRTARTTEQVARPVKFYLREDCVQVMGTADPVWVEFQRRAPEFYGATWSATGTYSAGDTVYHTTTGDYWTARASTAAGESPSTTPAKWSRIEFPYYLAEFVAQSVYAMLTNREQQQPESFSVQMTAGLPLLMAEIDRIERMQGQVRQLRVRR